VITLTEEEIDKRNKTRLDRVLMVAFANQATFLAAFLFLKTSSSTSMFTSVAALLFVIATGISIAYWRLFARLSFLEKDALCKIFEITPANEETRAMNSQIVLDDFAQFYKSLEEAFNIEGGR
jgi:hypothetical protein